MENPPENKPKVTMRNIGVMLREKTSLHFAGNQLLRSHLDDEIYTYGFGHKGFYAVVKLRGGYTGAEFTLLFDAHGSHSGVLTEVPVDYALDKIKNAPFLATRVVADIEMNSKYGVYIGKVSFKEVTKETARAEIEFCVYKKNNTFIIVRRYDVREDRVYESEFLEYAVKGEKWNIKYKLSQVEFVEGYEWEQVLTQMKSQYLIKEL